MPGASKNKNTWIHQPTLIISMAAFIISLVTTVASAYRTYRQDVEARKTELRALISQFNAAQLQSIELEYKYKNDPYLPNISSTLNVQNMVTIKQAYLLVKELGRDASSIDFGIIAYALSSVGDMGLAEEMNLKAMETAANATEYLGPVRQLGVLKMQTGKTAEAEVYWKKALNVFDTYPKGAINEQYVHYTHAWTLLSWAESSGDCKAVFDHVAAANKEIEALGASVPGDILQMRARSSARCAASTTTGVFPSPELSNSADKNPWQLPPTQKQAQPSR